MVTVKTLFQHASKPTWFENIAFRPRTGTILVTNLLSPTAIHVDHSASPPVTSTILTISSAQSLSGICHVRDDVFAVAAGEYSLEKGPVDGSWGIYLADLSVSPPKVEYIANIASGLINGIATWNENTILVTDCSPQGMLYKVDLANKSAEKALAEEEMTCPPDSPLPVSINGIKVFRTKGESWVYWTNTARMAFYRIQVSEDLAPVGPVEKLADGFMPDDFVLAKDGTAYVAFVTGNKVLKVDRLGGETTVVAGRDDSLELGGITALAFGKGEDILYASTSGAIASPVNGKETEPAKVVEIQLG